MARTKGRMRDEMHMSLSDVIQSTSVKYDAVPFSIEDDYDTDNDDHPIDMTKSRRWSILDKLERRCNSLSRNSCQDIRICIFFDVYAKF